MECVILPILIIQNPSQSSTCCLDLVLHSLLGFALYSVDVVLWLVLDRRSSVDIGGSVLLGAATLPGGTLTVLVVTSVLALAGGRLRGASGGSLLLGSTIDRTARLDRLELGLQLALEGVDFLAEAVGIATGGI
jgi:hypothetical protein